jgi:hypothetical protein
MPPPRIPPTKKKSILVIAKLIHANLIKTIQRLRVLLEDVLKY